MVKLIISAIIFVFSLNQCQGQLFTDTIFSGRTRFVDMTSSISNLLIINFQEMNLCTNVPERNYSDAHLKANIPFLLQYYSKRGLKNASLMEFDALIYTALCGQYEFMYETYIMELFFEDDKKAKAYVKSLDKVNNFFEYAKKHDVLESEDELVSVLKAYNFFYQRKGNIIYLFHKNIPLNDDLSTVKPLKLKFFELVDILCENRNK
jgi:hypothetical protein